MIWFLEHSGVGMPGSQEYRCGDRVQVIETGEVGMVVGVGYSGIAREIILVGHPDTPGDMRSMRRRITVHEHSELILVPATSGSSPTFDVRQACDEVASRV